MSESISEIKALGRTELNHLWLGMTSGSSFIECFLSPELIDQPNINGVLFSDRINRKSNEWKAINENGVYIWLLKYDESKYRIIHIGLSRKKKSTMMERTQYHYNKSIANEDCMISGFNKAGSYSSDFSKCILECECIGRHIRTTKCTAKADSVYAYLHNVRILYLSIPFPEQIEAESSHLQLIYRLEGTIIAATNDYFAELNNINIEKDEYFKYILNTRGMSFNFSKCAECDNSNLPRIREMLNLSTPIFEET